MEFIVNHYNQRVEELSKEIEEKNKDIDGKEDLDDIEDLEYFELCINKFILHTLKLHKLFYQTLLKKNKILIPKILEKMRENLSVDMDLDLMFVEKGVMTENKYNENCMTKKNLFENMENQFIELSKSNYFD